MRLFTSRRKGKGINAEGMKVSTALATKYRIFVDKTHFKNHVGEYCRANCDPALCEISDRVNTQVCEQTFAWLKGYRGSVKYMRPGNFMFLLFLLCDQHNELKLKEGPERLRKKREKQRKAKAKAEAAAKAKAAALT